VRVKYHGEGVKHEDPIIQDMCDCAWVSTSFQLFYQLSSHLYDIQNVYLMNTKMYNRIVNKHEKELKYINDFFFLITKETGRKYI